MIKLKSGARIDNLQPEIVLGILIAEGVYDSLGVDLVITEVTGSKHQKGSLHYVGLAVDLRSRDFSKEQLPVVLANLRENLGTEFDVVYEQDHVHVEFDPKEGK